jgi:hypothetical protein
MKKSFIAVIFLAMCSCSFIKSNEAALSADQVQAVSCVLSAVAAGQPIEVIACGITDLGQIVALADAAKLTITPSPALAAVRAAQSDAKK